jgi:ribosomal-protein-alanine N-acetyltransferase
VIREYRHEDVEAIFRINKESFDRPQPNVGLLSEIVESNNKTWVAEVDRKVVGFLISSKTFSGHIYNIAVNKNYRGQGIGTALLKQFEEFYSKEFSHLWLLVHMENPAQKLYFDMGYRVTDVKKDYYYPDQHALVMVKQSS